jgi:cell division protein FtsL
MKNSTRTLWIIALVLWFGVLLSSTGAIYTRHRARELFVELEALHRQRDNLDIEWGRLQLEQSSWSTHAFVERVASTRLHMAIPDPARIQVVQP